MADRVQKMLEKQREREEAMKKKEAEKQSQVEKQKSDQNAAYLAKNPTAAAKKTEAPATPTDNWFIMRKNLYAPIPAPIRGKPTLLGGDPAGENLLICLGNSVIIRNLSQPLIADIYSEHNYPTSVARYSPDRKFIASGDQSGTVRIWHTEIIQGIVHKLKLEKKTLGGAILDLQWDPESKRILAVGQGRDKFGIIFFAESGAGAGDITGHSKPITCCSHRPVKPYRIITGGEDFVVNWVEGPPYKWKHSLKNFTNFVNDVKFSPDGKLFLMVGQDKKGYFGDGETGEIKYELDAASAHTGGVYSCSWAPDGSQVLTVSGDKTAKIWEASSGKCLATYNYGKDTEDQLLGCLWQGNHKVVMNLSGHLLYLPPESSSPPLRILKGHNRSIEALVYDSTTKSFFSGSYDTVISKWNEETAEVTSFKGKGHTNAIKRMALRPGKDLITVSLDDTLRVTPLSSLTYSADSLNLGAPPAGVCVGKQQPDLIIAATAKSLLLIKGTTIVATKDASNFCPQALALSPDDSHVAVGGENNIIYLFTITNNNFVEAGQLVSHRGPITRLDYSPDGKWLAAADRNREVLLWDLHTKQVAIKEWVFHTARVDGLAFSPDSLHVVSAGLDQTIIVWSVTNPSNRIIIKGAHQGGINEVVWIDNKTVLSAGQDCTIRSWNVL